MTRTETDSATAFAPATVANVAVGFDILGFAIAGAGDTVTVSRQTASGVSIQETDGIPPNGLPKDPEKNTATAGLLALIREHKLKHGFQVRIKKGIPLSSGMGGSAASAVAAIVAANELLDQKLPNSELLRYALVGEAVASGAVHADNVAPCLLGGLVLVRSAEAQDIVQLPSPNLVCVLVHPNLQVSTRDARKILKPDISLGAHVRQSSRLAGFMAGCFSGDLELLARCLEDEIIEPQRAGLILGFGTVKRAALKSGAIGCSISGSGPSVFAWSKKEAADQVARAMVSAFRDAGVAQAKSWVSPMPSRGAQVVG